VPPKKRGGRGALAVVIAIVVSLFTTGLTVFIFVVVRPKGTPIGQIDVRDPKLVTQVDVDAAPGEKLYFRFDSIEVVPPPGASPDRQRDAREAIRESTVTVVVLDSRGASRSVTCGAYSGTSTTTVSSPRSFSMSGVNIDCVMPIETAGHYVVRASVAWRPAINVSEAKLEVRKGK